MASINPISTALRLILSLGEEDGKNVTKTVSINNVNVNADADTLHATAEKLAPMVEYPVIDVRRNRLDSIVE